MFLTPVSLGSTLFFFLSGLTTVYSNQLSHVWLSLKPCVPLLCHKCFFVLYQQYSDILPCLPPFKNRNKNYPLAHIPSGYYPLLDLQWIKCLCLLSPLFLWPSPWNAVIQGLLLTLWLWVLSGRGPLSTLVTDWLSPTLSAHLAGPPSCKCHSC